MSDASAPDALECCAFDDRFPSSSIVSAREYRCGRKKRDSRTKSIQSDWNGDMERGQRSAFRCPHCSHGFERRTGKRNITSCPKCRQRFAKSDAVVTGADATQIRKDRYERRKEISKKHMGSSAKRSVVEIIRSTQIPTSVSEAKFKARALEKGWKPHRPSWPDFLVETEAGRLIAVEVKSRTDRISKTQRATFNLLESAGIPVYVWRDVNEGRNVLVRWDQGLGLIKIGMA